MNIEGDVRKSALSAQTLNHKQAFALLRLIFVEKGFQLAPDHIPNRTFRCDFSNRPGGNPLPISENRDPVTNFKYLFHAMADEQNSHPLVAQRAHKLKEPGDFMG